MKKVLVLLLCCTVCMPMVAQEANRTCPPPRRPDTTGYGSRDATVLSMMGWGIGLGVLIATICALIPSNSD